MGWSDISVKIIERGIYDLCLFKGVELKFLIGTLGMGLKLRPEMSLERVLKKFLAKICVRR